MLHVFSQHAPLHFAAQEDILTVSSTSKDGRDIQQVTSWAQELLRHRSSTFHASILDPEGVLGILQRDSWNRMRFMCLLSPAPNEVTYTLDIPGPIQVMVREKTSEGFAIRVRF